MPAEAAVAALTEIPNLEVLENAPLSEHTRFGIGGPARILAQTSSAEAFVAALSFARASGELYVVIGGGTNLIVADEGFAGIVLKYTGRRMLAANGRINVEAGAVLQDLVDFAIEHGLAGLETLAGIPGWVGAAIYGNAGAYGHSISEVVSKVRFFDGESVRVFDNEQCEFRYRESVFKRRKDCIIFSAELMLRPADREVLHKTASDIVKVRNEKFPPTMKCAGSIFKNLIRDELPEKVRAQVPVAVVREGKVPAAWFLEQVGAKGLKRGSIHVADYHANLIFNAGGGTARELTGMIRELKSRVRERFEFDIEEEVQYVGFDTVTPALAQMENTAAVLRALLAGVPDELAARKPEPDRFSLAEVAAHLAQVETACYNVRLTKMLGEDEPEIEEYDQKEDERLGLYSGRGLAESMAEFERRRAENLGILRGLAAGDFQRVGRHRILGRFTVAEMLNECAGHDLGHIRQVAMLLRDLRHIAGMGAFERYYRV